MRSLLAKPEHSRRRRFALVAALTALGMLGLVPAVSASTPSVGAGTLALASATQLAIKPWT